MITYAAQTDNSKAPEWARSTSHLCGAITTLKAQLDQHYPDRDRTSDGFIGDARHLTEGTGSDHNPWVHTELGWTVRAGDFDVDGINAGWLAEQLRLAGAAGDPRLIGGGYVIYAGHITSPDFSHWTPYVGDPHTTHVHVSTTRSAACELTGPWRFLDAAQPTAQPTDPGPIRPAAPTPPPAPAIDPDMTAPAARADAARTDPFTPTGKDARGAGTEFRADVGDEGPRVAALQEFLRGAFGLYAGALVVDGVYWQQTAAVIAEFAVRSANDPATPAGDREGLAQSDGQNVGPRIARRLAHFGFGL